MTRTRIVLATASLLLLATSSQGAQPPDPKPGKDSLFNRCDKNGDGVLDRAEFKMAAQRWRERLADLRQAVAEQRDDGAAEPARRGDRADARPGPGAADLQPPARPRADRPDDGQPGRRGKRIGQREADRGRGPRGEAMPPEPRRQRGDAFGTPRPGRDDDRTGPPRRQRSYRDDLGDARQAPMGAGPRAEGRRPRNPGPACDMNVGQRGSRGFGPGPADEFGPGFGRGFGPGDNRDSNPRLGRGLGRGIDRGFDQGVGPGCCRRPGREFCRGFARGFCDGAARGFRPGFGALDGPDFQPAPEQDRPRFGNRAGREARMDRRMQRFDMDHDGAISRQEFDRRCDRFDEFDTDDDDTISRDEMLNAPPARRPRDGMRMSPPRRPDAPPARGDLPPDRDGMLQDRGGMPSGQGSPPPEPAYAPPDEAPL